MIIEICTASKDQSDGGQQETKRVPDPCWVAWDDVFNLHWRFIKSPILFQNRGWWLRPIPAPLLSLCTSSFVALTGVLAFMRFNNPKSAGGRESTRPLPTPPGCSFSVSDVLSLSDVCDSLLLRLIGCFSIPNRSLLNQIKRLEECSSTTKRASKRAWTSRIYRESLRVLWTESDAGANGSVLGVDHKPGQFWIMCAWNAMPSITRWLIMAWQWGRQSAEGNNG